jgi:hypothetical protein
MNFWSIKCENSHLSIIKSLIFTYKIIENKNKNLNLNKIYLKQ